jgi:hypothetical protein
MSSDSSRGAKGRKKPRFTKQDDQTILQLIEQLGDRDWVAIAACLPGRTPRSCRERWRFFLNANPSDTPWTPEDDDLLRDKVREHGRKWITIQAYFTGRTSVNVKNRYALLERSDRPARPQIKRGRKPKQPQIQDPPTPVHQTPSLDGPIMAIEQLLIGMSLVPPAVHI